MLMPSVQQERLSGITPETASSVYLLRQHGSHVPQPDNKTYAYMISSLNVICGLFIM